MQNLKKPKELRLQLPITFGFDIFAIQQKFLIGDITSRLSSFIVGLFLQFLDVLWFFFLCSHEIFKFCDQLISCFRLEAGVNVLFIENALVVPAVELERRISRAGVF